MNTSQWEILSWENHWEVCVHGARGVCLRIHALWVGILHTHRSQGHNDNRAVPLQPKPARWGWHNFTPGNRQKSIFIWTNSEPHLPNPNSVSEDPGMSMEHRVNWGYGNFCKKICTIGWKPWSAAIMENSKEVHWQRHPSTTHQQSERKCVYNGKPFSLKRKIPSFTATTWRMLSTISQAQKHRYCMTSLIYEIIEAESRMVVSKALVGECWDVGYRV